METNILYGVMPLEGSDQLHIRVSSYKGNKALDIRRHYNDGKDYKPSGKGVRIPLEHIDNLICSLKLVKEDIK